MPEGIQIDRKTGGEALPSGDPANAPAEAASNSQTAPEKSTQAKPEAVKTSSTNVEQAQKDTGLHTNGSTLDTTPRSLGKELQRLPSLDRDVSPATMPDGSHAQTSGDRGESYTPSTMSKFKNKLHFGGSK